MEDLLKRMFILGIGDALEKKAFAGKIVRTAAGRAARKIARSRNLRMRAKQRASTLSLGPSHSVKTRKRKVNSTFKAFEDDTTKAAAIKPKGKGSINEGAGAAGAGTVKSSSGGQDVFTVPKPGGKGDMHVHIPGGGSRPWKDYLLPAAAVSGISIGMLGLLGGADVAWDKMTAGRDFRRAVKEAPSLRKNQSSARKHFNTFRRINANMSKDPVLSAGYIKKAQTYEREGLDPALVRAIADDRSGNVIEMWKGLQKAVPGVTDLD